MILYSKNPYKDDDMNRRWEQYIGGYGVLAHSYHIVVLHYPNTTFKPNDNAVPSGLRPKLENGAWGKVSASTEHTHDYRLQVLMNGVVQLQIDGVNTTSSISIRGQVVWIV